MRKIKHNEQPSPDIAPTHQQDRQWRSQSAAREARDKHERERCNPSVFSERRYITVRRLEYDSQMSRGRFMQICRAAVGGPLVSCDVRSVMFFGPIFSHEGQTASESLQG